MGYTQAHDFRAAFRFEVGESKLPPALDEFRIGGAGRDGETLTSRRLFHQIRPKSLRLNAKRGIVACLDAAGWVRIRDDPDNS
jgi:hypothetical protein